MDPGEILSRGRAAALEGRHEDALRDFAWFHEHALEHDMAYYGVRLSFALGYWMELAHAYPPALEALQAVKARGEQALRRGEGGRRLFHEVRSINREMACSGDTCTLFQALRADQPVLARQCADLAVDALVEAGEFELASGCLPHPENYLLLLSERLHHDLGRKVTPPETEERRREACVGLYCHDVGTTLRILEGLGNTEAAQSALEWAIALVRPPEVRDLVCAQLVGR